jgi:hypothetical protein
MRRLPVGVRWEWGGREVAEERPRSSWLVDQDGVELNLLRESGKISDQEE